MLRGSISSFVYRMNEANHLKTLSVPFIACTMYWDCYHSDGCRLRNT